jgi:hypothetical protein
MSSAFSIVFTLGREQEVIDSSVERQTYTISFLEYMRNATNTVEYEDGNWMSTNGHVFRYIASSTTFSHPDSSHIYINGNFELRRGVNYPYIYPIYAHP